MTLTAWLKSFAKPGVERKLADTMALEPLLSALQDEDPSIRRQAVVPLGDRGDRRATEELIRELKDRDDDVRKKAAYTLYVFLKQEGLDPGLREKILSHWRSWYLT